MSRAGFLDRWSARKREEAGRATRTPSDAPTSPDANAPTEAPTHDEIPSLTEEAAAQMTDAEALSALRLPDPTALPHGADFSAFLRAGVPRRLQRMALRRLWTVSPEQAALDGLVDYAEDYTDAAVAVETLATTYQAGRGLRAHTEALARAEEDATREQDVVAESEDEIEADRDGDSSAEPSSAVVEYPSPRQAVAAEPVSADEPVQNVARHNEKSTAASPRRAPRMTFRFDDA